LKKVISLETALKRAVIQEMIKKHSFCEKKGWKE